MARLAEEMGVERAAILSQVQRVRRKAESNRRQKEFRTFPAAERRYGTL